MTYSAVTRQSPAPSTPPDPPAGLHPALQRALAHMEACFAEPVTLAEIARAANLSPTYLSQLFTAETGRTLTAHLRQIRMEHAARLLRGGECNVTEAARAVGYASVGQFSHAYRRVFGHPPGRDRARFGPPHALHAGQDPPHPHPAPVPENLNRGQKS